jgi:nucleotidyltransferase/DNA polymerase involved in DNA repair
VWSEPILHVDMDSFFVEVERLADPSLRGVPVAVGGAGRRGVIASASYEARRFGVHSAQPTAMALRACPGLRLVPPRHQRYAEASASVFEIFRSLTPIVEGLSLDEAFLDVGGLRLHHASSVAVGEEVRRVLREELGLPASVGVASVKFIAKLASEVAKPDGIRHVPVDEQRSFLAGLPVTAVWGVGPATFAALSRLGVETIGDLADLPVSSLVAAVGPSAGRHLHELSNGVDPREVVADSLAKSISVEETYARDLVSQDVVETALLALAQRLSARLRGAGLRCRTLTLKMRLADFTTTTRSATRDGAFDGFRQTFRLAREMLSSLPEPGPVRLLGLGASSLEPVDGPVQLGLETDQGWEQVEEALADVEGRFGEGVVRPARLIRPEEIRRRVEEP